MRWIFLLAVFCMIVDVAHTAEAPKPDPLASCQAELSVTLQYALQQSRSRTAVEQELARARAENAQLRAQIAESSKKAEKPAPTKAKE